MDMYTTIICFFMRNAIKLVRLFLSVVALDRHSLLCLCVCVPSESVSCAIRSLDVPLALCPRVCNLDSNPTHTLLNCTRLPSRRPLASPLPSPIPTSVSARPPPPAGTFFVAKVADKEGAVRTVKQGELTPGIPASEYERRRKQLVDGLPDGSLVVCVAGHVKYMSAGEHTRHPHALLSPHSTLRPSLTAREPKKKAIL